jgi:hypothetical protein
VAEINKTSIRDLMWISLWFGVGGSRSAEVQTFTIIDTLSNHLAMSAATLDEPDQSCQKYP